MYENLKIIFYPDPRLKKVSVEVTAFDENLKALATRMFELMRAGRGVGLAGAQVGENIRLFVANPTGQPQDDRVYVNPVLTEIGHDDVESEEGCLSLPEINIQVVRAKSIHIAARDVEGKAFEADESGYAARIWQHENDHLNGILLTDKMGPVAKIANRRILKELEAKWAAEHGKK